jgi:hypothetical protein
MFPFLVSVLPDSLVAGRGLVDNLAVSLAE